MANTLNLTSTKFVSPTGETYGYRIYDDYDASYNNTIDRETYFNCLNDDMKHLQIVANDPIECVAEMLFHIQEMEKGMYINGEWYDYDEIKHCL